MASDHERKKKAWKDRVLTSSRVRTGKKQRKTRSRRQAPMVVPRQRLKPTTGRIDYTEDRQKIFTPVS